MTVAADGVSVPLSHEAWMKSRQIDYRTGGKVAAPCHTAAGIAAGLLDNPLTRAASVVLKERFPLVLMVHEALFSSIHLQNLPTQSQLGATISLRRCLLLASGDPDEDGGLRSDQGA